MMHSRYSSLSAVVSVALHVALVLVVSMGLLKHSHDEIEKPPVIVELIRPRLEPPPPPPKPEPPKPEPPKPKPPKPEPAKPEPPRPEVPRPVPTPAPTPVPAPAVTVPETKPAPQPPEPAPVAKPAPTPQAPPAPPAKTDVSISASYSASNAKPVYPSMSKRMGEQGTVVLRVLVKSDGTAGGVEVKSSSGFPRLDQSAVDAVKSWRFNPATLDGKPVDEWYQVPIPFKLQN